jgi:methionine sulfoxide reductase heme-binding subunit
MTTWIVLRAAGIGAYLMLFASVAWGLLATTSTFGKRVAKATAISVHQFTATVALVLLGVHLGGLLMDRFVPFTPLDLLIPMHSSYRTIAVAFGIVAMYAAVVVLTSSWTRKHLNIKLWRRLHLLAVPAFTLSMVHGIFAGSDTARPWMWWIYVATGGVALFLLVLRGLTVGLRPARAAHSAAAGVGRAVLRAETRGGSPSPPRPGRPAPHGSTLAPRATGRSPGSRPAVRPSLASGLPDTLEIDGDGTSHDPDTADFVSAGAHEEPL